MKAVERAGAGLEGEKMEIALRDDKVGETIGGQTRGPRRRQRDMGLRIDGLDPEFLGQADVSSGTGPGPMHIR